MKLKIIEIEATAEEIKSSNSLADGVSNILRGVFNGNAFVRAYEDEPDQEEEE